MKVLIACGGTGGHIYPGIAVADELKRRHPDWEFLFVGCIFEPAMENRLVPEAGYEIVDITADSFESYSTFMDDVKSTLNITRSIFQTMGILRRNRPAVVIGTGGFVCAPVVLTAHLMGYPSMILEQNVIPGRTNKLLSCMADRICISFEESRQYMKKQDVCVVTGNPLRGEFDRWDRISARKQLGLTQEEKLVLIFGGSLGARSLNDAVVKMIDKVGRDPSNRILFITGGEHYENVKAELEALGIDEKRFPNVTVCDYRNDMPVLMNAADLIVSRSGATTISEINHVGVATVYVPLKHAPNDHQRLNALANVERGAALMCEDDEELAGSLTECVLRLLSDDGTRLEMANASLSLGVNDSCSRICDLAEELIDSRKKK
ncbi:MAG: undecaprenyldiphospho-muramoylpentapeptide beta-N-acetylglucosaminyltransferase [Eubacteriaceae bacterium]|nr:undecaprenyldiphospho-muramoylpentapeptide beta-N-acetylglucosaminyltransferase [Eubacteriaceae bacterium]